MIFTNYLTIKKIKEIFKAKKYYNYTDVINISNENLKYYSYEPCHLMKKI